MLMNWSVDLGHLWKMMVVILEMVVAVEVENLVKRLVVVAFARFHPPDHWSRKQSWREEWYVVANAVVYRLVDSDPSTQGRALLFVV